MKKIKVFFMGKKLCEVYPHATKWQVFKYNTQQFLRKVMRYSMIALTLYIAFFIGGQVNQRVVFADREVSIFPQKVDDLKNQLVEKLAKCESAGHKEEDGIIIFDSNNVPSIGVLQFQRKTVMYYYKTLYGQTITPQDAVVIANDGDQAKKLAKDIIFKTSNGVEKDWVNCSKKLGLQAEVNLIKQLEK